MLRAWWHRLKSVGARSRLDPNLEQELQFHIDMLAQQNEERGLSPAEARAAAMRTFGPIDLVKANVRDTWFATMVENLVRDVRLGVRMLTRSPGYSLVVTSVMALGIGANTAIFSVVNGVLLRPLPFAGGDRLVELHQYHPRIPADGDIGFSAKEIADYRTANTLQDVVEYHHMWFILLGRREPERVATGVVSAAYFDVFGVKPMLGRTFRAEDDKPGAPAVLVLSHRYWERSFGSDPKVVGRVFRMNDRPHEVIGVLPALPEFPDENDVFMPTSACPFRSAPAMVASRTGRMVRAFARLKPGVRIEEAQADLSVFASRLAAAYPDAYPSGQGLEAGVVPLKTELTQTFEPTLLLLVGTATFVLLIVCASVANLLLARLARREREMAVRTALGAPRGRLLRQVLTESALLAVAGGIAGLALSAATLDLLVAFAARFTPRAAEISIDRTVLLFTLGMSLVTGILFGCIPALTARYDVLGTLREGTGRTTTERQPLRSGLIVAQVAISFVLLIGAGLMGRSLVNLQNVDPGFRANRVLTMRVDLNFTKYDSQVKRAQFYRRTLERIAAEPGVESVAASATFPLNDGGVGTLQFRIEGKVLPEGAKPPEAGFRSASPAYFRTMGIPVLSGRVFTNNDNLEHPLVVAVNQTFVRHYLAGDEPLGRRISFDGDTWGTVVGVVADTRQRLDRESGDEIYFPVLQVPQLTGSWLVSTTRDPGGMARQIRAAMHEIDPEQPIDRFRTLDQVRDANLAPPRLTTMLLMLFACLALVVTAAGMAGVIAFSVSQRTHEFGVRMALGAQRASVLAMVLRQGVSLVVVGLGIGALGALMLTGVISGLLFGVRPTDAMTYGVVAAVFVVVAVLACVLPAHRAASVDPLIALRQE